MIYLLTAIGLTPGGSSAVQYTFTHKQYTEQQLWQSLVEHENSFRLGNNLIFFVWTILTVLCVQFPLLSSSCGNISLFFCFIWTVCVTYYNTSNFKLHGYTVHQTMLKTFSLPTDAHTGKKHRVIKTF